MAKELMRKLHFGDRTLTSEILPPDTLRIGDWAYARCRNLRRIALPATLAELGKEVFQDCDALTYVYAYESPPFSFPCNPKRCENVTQVLAMLNACGVRHFADPLPLLTGGSNNDLQQNNMRSLSDDLRNWDIRCLAFLDQPDDLGFRPFLAGGEEDYTESEAEYTSFCSLQRTKKATVLYRRLLAEQLVPSLPFDPVFREVYRKRFREIPESISLLTKTDDHIRETVEIYHAAGFLSPEHFDTILATLPPEKVELRSALLSRKVGNPLDPVAPDSLFQAFIL